MINAALDCDECHLTTFEAYHEKYAKVWAQQNDLTSLRGCPAVYSLIVYENELTSLEFCPSTLIELDVEWNKLSSLDGCPLTIVDLSCSHNPLTTLPNFSALVNLTCHGNNLTSLLNLPNCLEQLFCSENMLTTCRGLPHSLTKLIIRSNQLENLIGRPPNLKFLNFGCNKITSLVGLSSTRELKNVICNTNLLTSLEGLPRSVVRLTCFRNKLDWPNEVYTGKGLKEIHKSNVNDCIAKLNAICVTPRSTFRTCPSKEICQTIYNEYQEAMYNVGQEVYNTCEKEF